MQRRDCDLLIIGSGIAGLSLAIEMAGRVRVAIVTKKDRADSNTNYAQGGIAAVMGPDDEPALHIADTLRAGAGLCHEDAVALLVEEGPGRIRQLIEWGARFTVTESGLSLGREGGHSRRRIVHAGDFTGREIERVLLEALGAHPDVELFEDHLAVELLLARGPEGPRCAGAVVLDRTTGELVEFRAGATVLASGGLGRAYRHTTNPAIATGDGVAMAFRAGAVVANLEFVQFHPTALYPAEERAFLISEAVRGEGAVLRRMNGELLLQGHPMGSLATRDVVARAIDAVMRESGDPYVLLDLSPIPRERIASRFPVIFQTCLERGIDIRYEPIPVVPAAHYACGGVSTDLWGRTSLAGLYAAGETACTGVHGANRLASNSLLEALVYSHRIAQDLSARPIEPPPEEAWPAAPLPTARGAVAAAVAARAATLLDELRSLMWAEAGIVRSDAGLQHAAERLRELAQEIDELYTRAPASAQLVELRNLALVSRLIVDCARSRLESRGLHFNVDHPEPDDARFLRDSVIVPETPVIPYISGRGPQ